MEWLDIVKDLNAGTVGGIAGIAAGHPLDTVKVQLQISREAGAGVLRTLQRIVGSDGAAGLYRGLLSPIVSNAPINAVVFGVQGQVSQSLEGKQMNMTEMVRIRMQQEGPRFFFKGFNATMLRAFPVSAVTFLVYEKTMQFMS
ncbi:unnamed protein product [Peronospora destructor]|uniref:Uncharacterized protein n=1 Tax=Peronospora destructor TaxID=86335 RepID=A0AAV0TLA1_9STRA|nr:unnamed protein product [Peronospora destructor]